MELHELVAKLKALAHKLGKTPTSREFIASGISGRQIHKYKFSEILKASGLSEERSSNTIEPEIRPPRILVFYYRVRPEDE